MSNLPVLSIPSFYLETTVHVAHSRATQKLIRNRFPFRQPIPKFTRHNGYDMKMVKLWLRENVGEPYVDEDPESIRERTCAASGSFIFFLREPDAFAYKIRWL